MNARELADGIELRLKLMAEADEAGMDGVAKSLGYFISSFSSEILTALRAAPEGWRPIETCPNDGREYLMWKPVRTSYEEDDQGLNIVIADVGTERLIRWGYTHWQPLSEPPSVNGEQS